MAGGGVHVEALTKVFRSRRRGDVVAVTVVSFDVAHGEIVGLLGANGAGKTTTIKCLCGLVLATSGAITIDGHDVVSAPARAGRHVAAVLEGNRNLYWRMTVEENIDLFAGLQGISRRGVRAVRDELIGRFDLGDKHRTPARMLSRGMQQKLSLACAVARQTPVLVLDEPTLGLDVETSHELRAMMRDLSAERTILLSSHDMAVVQDVCDRVVVLATGRVVADDRVTNLLGLLAAQAHRFVVEGPLDDLELRARFPTLTVAVDSGATAIEVDFTDDDGLYDLVDILRRGGARVVSVDRSEPDLEQVFLHIVREGRR